VKHLQERRNVARDRLSGILGAQRLAPELAVADGAVRDLGVGIDSPGRIRHGGWKPVDEPAEEPHLLRVPGGGTRTPREAEDDPVSGLDDDASEADVENLEPLDRELGEPGAEEAAELPDLYVQRTDPTRISVAPSSAATR
jgi:hypothetical protein